MLILGYLYLNSYWFVAFWKFDFHCLLGTLNATYQRWMILVNLMYQKSPVMLSVLYCSSEIMPLVISDSSVSAWNRHNCSFTFAYQIQDHLHCMDQNVLYERDVIILMVHGNVFSSWFLITSAECSCLLYSKLFIRVLLASLNLFNSLLRTIKYRQKENVT